MPQSELSRILNHRLKPRIIELWQALAPLQSVVSFMSTGAHPDDEKSAMLAALGLRDGLDLSYACSTRGEGGQNDIGTESGVALGVLRTAEMEKACEVLNMTQYWLSQYADDSISDFGFSKSGSDTLATWGRERTLYRFVEIVRTERPDIICPTFLNVPGQHGHHRAMTEVAHLVMDLAADPAFSTGQRVWQVKKLYLPAWSGAGQAYDDDLPPPPETLRIAGGGRDPVSGFSYAQIGQQSRAFHRSQGMGRWVSSEIVHDWPLHLADSRVDGPDNELSSGLAATLKDLDFADAQAHFDVAREAFPDVAVILQEVSAGLAILKSADIPVEYAHKLQRKIIQASRVIRIAAGVDVDACLDRDVLQNGESTSFNISLVSDVANVKAELILPKGWREKDGQLHLDNAELSAALPDYYCVDNPSLPCIEISVNTHGVSSGSRLPLAQAPVILPTTRSAVDPSVEILNLNTNRRLVTVRVDCLSPVSRVSAEAKFQTPAGWSVTAEHGNFSIDIGDAVPGSYRLPLLIDGKPSLSTRIIGHAYEHITPRALSFATELQVHILDCALPKAKIAYVGGGNDNVDFWLQRAGFDITALTVEDLMSETILQSYDTLIIGILAMKFREGLSDAMPQVHQWVKAGGNLLTLYHRPWDNWNAHTTPLKRIEIGQPSLRWRVTDQHAAVTHLADDHPILHYPNRIEATDWQGWHKERGLYFASSWDNSYVPLIEMADPDEAPLQGALLSAEIGSGRHSHCALILHHQLAKGVPGAYRLMANLLAPSD